MAGDLPEVVVYWDRSFPGNNPMGGHPGNAADAQMPMGSANSMGGADGVRTAPTAQQLGLDAAHDPVWQQRQPRQSVDPLGATHGLMQFAGQFDRIPGGDTRGTPNNPSPHAMDNVPFLRNPAGQPRGTNWTRWSHGMSNGEELFFWGSSLHTDSDNPARDMMRGQGNFATPPRRPISIDHDFDAVNQPWRVRLNDLLFSPYPLTYNGNPFFLSAPPPPDFLPPDTGVSPHLFDLPYWP